MYYSDERCGIREYAADPDAADANVARSLFGTYGFTKAREGISIYPVNDGTGYILVSDQRANAFRIFRREGKDHAFVKSVTIAAAGSDGNDVTHVPLGPDFPSGMVVAMSDDRTFHFYSWNDIAGPDLERAPNNRPQFDQLSPYSTIDFDDETVTYGNPELDPARSWNIATI